MEKELDGERKLGAEQRRTARWSRRDGGDASSPPLIRREGRAPAGAQRKRGREPPVSVVAASRRRRTTRDGGERSCRSRSGVKDGVGASADGAPKFPSR